VIPMKNFKINFILCFLVFISPLINAQYLTEEVQVLNNEIKLPSTILIPEGIKKPAVVLIIAGSGPTDRNGNNSFMKNNSLKFLAEELALKGIASMRYDKRIIPGNNPISEENLVFEDIISDADLCLKYLLKDKRFGKVYVAGHSQGSLIGMVISQTNKVKGFISIAGSSKNIGETIIEQVSVQSKELGEETAIIIDSLSQGYDVKKFNPLLISLFRPSVQGFMKSYLKYDPVIELTKLKIPVLIIQGTTDLQIKTEDAEALNKALPKSKLVIIDGMNHVLKTSVLDRNENIKTYTNPDLPVVDELVESISEFIK
jgi:esterase/lipase